MNRRHFVPIFIGVALAWLVGHASPLAAQPSEPAGIEAAQSADAKTIRVGALNNPPYASVGPDGLQGISISAFKILAKENNWKISYVVEQTQDQLTNAIITHQVEIGIGGITPTPDLGLVVDFSDANQIVALALVVKQESRWARLLHTIGHTGTAFMSGEMVALFIIGILAVLLAGYVIRTIERRRDPEMFPEEFRHNAWWAAQTLVAHNCGSKLPFSERGRYIALVLMLGGTVFTAEITALLTTSLAASIRANAPINGIGDVGSRRIATVDDSYAQDWLQQRPFDIRSYKSVAGCLEAVERGQVAGAVFDEMALRQALEQEHFQDLKVVGDTFGSHPHAFMLTKRSPYLAAVNTGLASILGSNEWRSLNARWLGGPRQ